MNISLTEFKTRLSSYIADAENSHWISNDDAESLLSQINKDQLTIGVVGQMNVGKSSLINALVFGDNVLPTSETPMTAALTYISYGENPKANVEMLSQYDLDEITEKSNCEITDENRIEVESAQKLIEKIIPIELKQKITTTQLS